MKLSYLFLFCGLALPACQKGISSAEFLQIVEDARACQPDDTCVIVPQTGCTCPVAVNESQAEAIMETAEQVNCDGDLDCGAITNPRCESGRCVANGYP